ncbi:succinate dehydrogenase/fumarate reductase iron-sulfur subunit [Haliangium ochraceum]|uniref:Succinate dehydrogenase and fumarate reductase iron-sulfur protein n=1 Tax=Haliangium ochraceum (strain DSM 14365 / JCM 11303 / SMP-2) TaxID=502025 RepID=D0LIJ8_HALO1|nr:succinate dehydrogenase/fumarate reductase iron-sulfur subunit [Haliangium ochraceum]ACY18354.1 succinate dehydrogenase and fumarate reductase iron-sulfur protein [Haliangium ochraceum DSM 14365]
MDLTLHVWRQKGPQDAGRMVKYEARGITEHMSFLEMLDVVNEELIERGEEPIAFDSDCREGICGTCSMVINGRAHGPEKGTTVCQLHMRSFKDGDTIYIEPWRARAFPVIRDLAVNRGAFDTIIQAGGYVSANCGSAPDANAMPVSKEKADAAFAAAACIGCGACVASCPNGSAMLFTAAKLAHLHNLPQGQAERLERTEAMVNTMDAAGFGNCTNHYECEAACPKEIDRGVMALMNRDYAKASLGSRTRVRKHAGLKTTPRADA